MRPVPKIKTVIIKSLPALKKSTQTIVNKYVRMRDANDGCISCCGGVDDAGHYWSMGANGGLRYNLDNLNGQCTSCNRFKSGNLLEYRLKLVEKIGIKRVKWLDAHRHDIHKWTRDELMEIQREYKEKIKAYES